MVKVFFAILLAFSISLGDEVKEVDLLTQKIQTLIEPQVYKQNSAYIDIIFSPKSDYYSGDRVDAVKIIQTLKDNGLLNLFFEKPSEVTLHFKTSGSPLFFVKIMGDTLNNIGYYRYVTEESNLNSSEFTWTINLTSEYATDPLILQQELSKSGCNIVNIYRNSPTDWTYVVDMRDGELNVETLMDGMEVKLKRSLYAKWINVSQVKKLLITSSPRNSWYPYIALYDSSLHLLKVIKRDSKRSNISLKFKDNVHYVKISDIYTLKNIRDDLVLTPIGAR
ncbi:hypothetical protein SMGD1_1561 [Sulfurimonas gotlandica GD1]|uniref:Periplasmic protein n=1 Tax=Sulfurimonas gotlandica (strain DSM 19862 / JCM 16533 / GD1) TaxID=929558 RepID=B6BHT4_SULGG|nr:hypothetical protein [Sulfurimonas gotlandica]EDZ63041.1 conserved hypothetical protein [Sulfurimonas gotlandica GD1]EHP30085.1 hypothetical protein SMGD1_1561 [Sulfurimonas gotlandica GD1]